MAISSLYPRKTMRNHRRFMMDRLDYDQKAEKTIDGVFSFSLSSKINFCFDSIFIQWGVIQCLQHSA